MGINLGAKPGFLIIGMCLLVLAFVLHVVGIALPGWCLTIHGGMDFHLSSGDNGRGQMIYKVFPPVEMGLFEFCVAGTCRSLSNAFEFQGYYYVQLSIHYDIQIVRVLEILACAFGGISALVFLLCFLFAVRGIVRNKTVYNFSAVLCILAGSCGLVGCVIFGAVHSSTLSFNESVFSFTAWPSYTLGHSFMVCVVSSLLFIASGVLALVGGKTLDLQTIRGARVSNTHELRSTDIEEAPENQPNNSKTQL